MKIYEILTERGEFTMKLSSKNADDYLKQSHKSSKSHKETRKRHKKIADRYDVNIVDDYDRYVASGSKSTDGAVGPLTNSPRK